MQAILLALTLIYWRSLAFVCTYLERIRPPAEPGLEYWRAPSSSKGHDDHAVVKALTHEVRATTMQRAQPKCRRKSLGFAVCASPPCCKNNCRSVHAVA